MEGSKKEKTLIKNVMRKPTDTEKIEKGRESANNRG